MATVLRHHSLRLACIPVPSHQPRSRALCIQQHNSCSNKLPWRLSAVPSREAQTSSRGGRPDVANSPFSDLGLEDFEEVPAVRVRQHVNPLRREFQIPHEPLAWHEVFADPNKPLMVDIGCGSGRFLLKRQKSFGLEQNALGIEIRRALVRRANKWAELLQLNSCVHYVFANATVSLSSMLSNYPGPVVLVTIQMPDPQFKQRHKKRRVVQPQLVEDIARLLAPGGRVFLQSDVEEVAVDMRNQFEQSASEVLSPAEEHRTGPVFFSSEVFIKRGPPVKKSAASQQTVDINTSMHENADSAQASPTADMNSAVHEDATSAQTSPTDDSNASVVTSTRDNTGCILNDGVDSCHDDGDDGAVTAGIDRLRDRSDESEQPSTGSVSSSQEGSHTSSVVDGAVNYDTLKVGKASKSGVEDELADDSWVTEACSELNDGGSDAESLNESESGQTEFQSKWRQHGWLLVNPMGIPTEREHFALSEGGQVYRVLLHKAGK